MSEPDSRGGGPGDISIPDDTLREKAEEFKEAAAKLKLESHQVVESTAEAESLAQDVGGEITRHPDGRIEVSKGGAIKQAHNIYVPMDSQKWRDTYNSFSEVDNKVEKVIPLDPTALLTSIGRMDEVVSGLKQGTDLTDMEQEKFENLDFETDQGALSTVEKYASGDGDWHHIDAVSKAMEFWEGRAASVFKITYVDRLNAILIGQTATAMALKDTLRVAQKAFHGAKKDVLEILQAGIDVIEASGENDVYADVNWSEELQVISQVAGLAAGASAFVPGGQVFASVAGLVSTTTGIAAGVDAGVKKNGGNSEPRIEGGNADEIYASVLSALSDSWTALETVENEAADLLREFYDLITSTADGRTYAAKWTDGNPITLTVRESYFEPRKPGKEKGYGDGLATVGKGSRDGDPPSHEDLSHPNVLGKPSDEGESFGADLVELWNVGNDSLPSLSDNYSSLAASTEKGSEGTESAFAREEMIAGGNSTGSGTGSLYPAWIELHSEFFNILEGSATNLSLVAETLKVAAEAFAEQDDAAASEIRKAEGELPWE